MFTYAYMYLFNNYGWYGTTVPQGACLAPVPVWVPYGSSDSLQPFTVASQNFFPHQYFFLHFSELIGQSNITEGLHLILKWKLLANRLSDWSLVWLLVSASCTGIHVQCTLSSQTPSTLWTKLFSPCLKCSYDPISFTQYTACFTLNTVKYSAGFV